jgi:hypothetical protein
LNSVGEEIIELPKLRTLESKALLDFISKDLPV